MDPDELQAIGRRVRKALKAAGARVKPLRIGVVSSFLTDMLADALVASLARRGILAEIDAAPYGALPGHLLAEDAPFAGCDLVAILPTHRDLLRKPPLGAGPEDARQAAAAESNFWASLWTKLSCPVVQLSFDTPAARVLSEGDGFLPGGALRHARDTNSLLFEAAPANVALIDAEALAAWIGPAWHDARTYALCKQPFANAAVGELAEALASAAASLLGKARKALVLDLDNTLWGGVIGDVGLEGIALGMEMAEGEAFVAFQTYVRSLAARGIILAVCSKNKHEIALDAFRNHSGMVLKEEDIACFAINFEDKATNLRRIAETLNIGLDSLVFVDDNPVERGWVKQQLPEILVIDLPPEPAGYARAIEAARPFPLQRLTAEDLRRGQSYRALAAQSELASSASDLDQFLAGLEPRATLEPLSAATSDRIVQLIRKTNQFKLNPRVFNLDELAFPGRHVLALSFADRMQDHGIVAVAVYEAGEDCIDVLNWVMSCRVFSRRLEHVMLSELAKRARAIGAGFVRAPFVSSPRNDIAWTFLEALGFTRKDGDVLEVRADAVVDGAGFMAIFDGSNEQ
ncbi:MAG TPA: HAD-IIIC family phosphatase [Allosphingosinicella sp.]|nr:HAD-IIIC family phosphatase [Allosphingosinicella sp.]